MFRRLLRSSVLSALLLVTATAGLPTAAGGVGVIYLPDVNRLVHGSVNVEQAFRVRHCIIHYEFGTAYGTAYVKARATHEDRGYSCTVETQVIAARGGRIVVGPRSVFTCGAPTRKGPCVPSVYLRWAQSRLPHANGFAALVHVNDGRAWPLPRTWGKDFITLSAF